jgi:hypothetical protein
MLEGNKTFACDIYMWKIIQAKYCDDISQKSLEINQLNAKYAKRLSATLLP